MEEGDDEGVTKAAAEFAKVIGLAAVPSNVSSCRPGTVDAGVDDVVGRDVDSSGKEAIEGVTTGGRWA